MLTFIISVFCIIFFCGFNFISEIKNEKGNNFYKKGELGKARAEYQGALKADPRQTPASYNLGNTFYREDSFESSSRAYEYTAQAEKEPFLKSKAYYNLGNSFYRQKQNEKAIEAYKNALRFDPADQDAKYNLELLTKKDENKKDKQKKDEQKKEDKKDDQQKQGQQNKQDQKQQDQSGGQGQEDKKNQEKQPPQAGEQEGAQNEPEDKPKSASEVRAEQILSALENQERQVLKLQGDQKNPRIQGGRRSAEKDW